MNIRPPAVAGTLYEADTQRLLAQVEAWLAKGTAKQTPNPPKALVVPHSGYHYSGETAATAFRLLEPVYDTIQRVVLLGAPHRDAFSGIALPGTDIFRTPLGDVVVDKEAVDKIAQMEGVIELPEAHRQEHSIEVQLPFLQTVLENFQLVPLIVGSCKPDLLTSLLDTLWGEQETLIVISTGLSRKLPYALAVAQDEKSAQNICHQEADFKYEQACGFNALNGFLTVAKQRNLAAKCLALTTSTDKNGQKENVRGFGSFVFY